ncbi:MAG: hypothetical protein WD599_04620 [Balneolaceae bacterium]
MNRTIREVADRFVNKLPSDKEVFQLQDFHRINIPGFLVDRIELEIKRKVEESVISQLKESKWVDLNSPEIIRARENFTESLVQAATLPRPFMPEVVEAAVEDTLSVLIQPRKSIPELLYGSNSSLPLERLEKAGETIFVFNHLVMAPIRYARKKNLRELSLDQCRKVIGRVDDKLVSTYNALHWTQLLEPHFLLFENRLDTDLLRMFFEDKQRPRIARQFDLMEKDLSRSEFIEVLSSPEMLDLEGEEKAQATLFESTDPFPKTGPERESDENQEAYRPSRGDGPDSVHSPSGEHDQDEEEPESFNTMFSPRLGQSGEEDKEGKTDDPVVSIGIEVHEEQETGEDVEKASLHQRFRFDPSADETEEKESEDEAGEEREDTFNRMFAGEDDQEIKGAGRSDQSSPEASEEGEIEAGPEEEKKSEELVEDPKTPDEREETSDQEEAAEDQEEWDRYRHEPEASIWQNFISEEEHGESYESGYEEEESESSIIDFTGDEQDEEEQTGLLMEWMSDDEKRFVRDIFSGSGKAYEETLAVLATFDNWKSATRYIEEEVFERNHIDMYDESAVDFTDRLHSFFIENKSSKSNS